MKKTQSERPQHEKKTSLPETWLADIREAVSVMRRGGIILYPTDTIWGIGCDATNDEAVRRVFEIKQRNEAKALITLVDSEGAVARYVECMPDVAWDLIEVTDRPLTIIYDGARNLAPSLVASDGSVGIRVTKELFSSSLCHRMGRAIVSTSANVSGQPSPHSFHEISEQIKQQVDYICTSRREESNPPASGIIKLGAGGEISIIR